jgi:hypothetical protein
MVAGSLGLLVGGGCLGGDAFLCESDGACQQGGVSGLCQPSGYCSFPDTACPTGQRYGDHAGGSLAGVCVDASNEGPGSSSDGTPPPVTTTSTTGVTTSTTEPPTTGVDGPVTTEPVGESDPGTTTEPVTTDGGEDDPGTSTGEPAQLVCWSDDFDDGMIDETTWCTYVDPGIHLDEPMGHLRFALVPEDWAMGTDGSGWATTCQWVPLLGAEAATEVLAVPQVSPHTEAFIELGNQELRLGLGVLGGEVYAFVFENGGYQGLDYQPYVPFDHRWLRIVGTEEGLVAETSSDGMAWDHVYTHAADLADLDGYGALGTWGEMVPLGPDEATFERFELCWLE